MSEKKLVRQVVTPAQAQQLPPPMVRFANNPTPIALESLFPGDSYSSFRTSLKERGIADWKDSKVIADFDKDGKITVLAAAVPRLPPTSEDYLLSNVPDFANLSQFTNSNADFSLRRQRLALFRQIVANEGMINNAVKKTTSLIAQDGNFKIRYAKQGKRPKDTVMQELNILLKYWCENVNA